MNVLCWRTSITEGIFIFNILLTPSCRSIEFTTKVPGSYRAFRTPGVIAYELQAILRLFVLFFDSLHLFICKKSGDKKVLPRAHQGGTVNFLFWRSLTKNCDYRQKINDRDISFVPKVNVDPNYWIYNCA